MDSISLTDFVDKLASIDIGPRTFFVYVPLPLALADSLKATQREVGGVAQDLDHITLVYTSDASKDRTPADIDSIIASLREVTDETHPIHAKIQGWAYFDGAQRHGEPKTALVALVDAPGLEDLHVALKEALKAKGVAPSAGHIFTAHFTFAYLTPGARVANLPKLSGEFDIDKVMVAADEIHGLPLRGSLGASAAKSAATVDQLQGAYRRLGAIRVPKRFRTEHGEGPRGPSFHMEGLSKPFIGAPPGGVQPVLRYYDLPRANTPEGMKAQNIVSGLHEGIERKAMNRMNAGQRSQFFDADVAFFGHANPRVMLDHNNMLGRLTGPGAAEARVAEQNLRSRIGEAPAITQAVAELSNGRFPYTFGETRLPKAMRRQLETRLSKTGAAESTDFNTMDARGVSPAPVTDVDEPFYADLYDFLAHRLKQRAALEAPQPLIPIPDVFKAGSEEAKEEPKGIGAGQRVLQGLGGFASPLLASEASAVPLRFEPKSGRGHLRTMLKAMQVSRQMGAGTPFVDTLVDGAAYNPDNGVMLIPRGTSEAVMAHEAGHRRMYQLLGNYLGVPDTISRVLSLAAPATGAWAGAAKEPTRLPGYLQAASALPSLLSEGGATAQALYHMGKRHGLKGVADAWPLIPAFGTYAGNALAPLGVARLREHFEGRPEEKQADALPGGKGDGKPKSLFDPVEFAKGQKVEREHTHEQSIADEITKDHLTENKKYYSKLQRAGLADELDKKASLRCFMFTR